MTEKVIQTLHALVMSDARTRVKPTLYRDRQNVIKDGSTGMIVYMPPESQDVPLLMGHLVAWIKESVDLPCPILAAIAHYQFATIHPYYDGNGRTARLSSKSCAVLKDTHAPMMLKILFFQSNRLQQKNQGNNKGEHPNNYAKSINKT